MLFNPTSPGMYSLPSRARAQATCVSSFATSPAALGVGGGGGGGGGVGVGRAGSGWGWMGGASIWQEGGHERYKAGWHCTSSGWRPLPCLAVGPPAHGPALPPYLHPYPVGSCPRDLTRPPASGCAHAAQPPQVAVRMLLTRKGGAQHVLDVSQRPVRHRVHVWQAVHLAVLNLRGVGGWGVRGACGCREVEDFPSSTCKGGVGRVG